MSEFDYEIEDLVNNMEGDQYNPTPNKPRQCIKCDVTFRCTYDLNICKNCFDTMMMTKTAAKRIYKLTEDELDNIKCHVRKAAYGGGIGTYYFKKDIMSEVIYRKFKKICSSKKEYRNYVKMINEKK